MCSCLLGKPDRYQQVDPQRVNDGVAAPYPLFDAVEYYLLLEYQLALH